MGKRKNKKVEVEIELPVETWQALQDIADWMNVGRNKLIRWLLRIELLKYRELLKPSRKTH